MLIFFYIIAWLIFVGISIEAGGFIFNSVYAFASNPAVAKHFWNGLDLSSLFAYDKGQFLVVTFIMSLVAVLRAVLFYMIIKIIHEKKLDLANPFNKATLKFLFMVSYVALLIGLFSFYGVKYVEWLQTKGITFPDIHYLRLGGADVWMFMSVTLFVIAHIFKKGIELQTENDLTV
ncbi:MAG: DUF2975 domain-containing protein [Chitinophagaceae bacterium]|nr:MAG: DUF2975 domain-containing protein [Chitinophagaceae bacterium]